MENTGKYILLEKWGNLYSWHVPGAIYHLAQAKILSFFYNSPLAINHIQSDIAQSLTILKQTRYSVTALHISTLTVQVEHEIFTFFDKEITCQCKLCPVLNLEYITEHTSPIKMY